MTATATATRETKTSTQTLVTGLMPGAWETLASALAGGAASGALPDGLEPHQRLLCLVEAPALAVARGLQGAAMGDPVTVLRAWCDQAQCALRLMQRHPGQCLLLDLGEVALNPAAAAAAWSELAGGAARMPTEAVPVSLQMQGDPLRLLIGEATLAADPMARALRDQLHAACAPLVEEGALPAGSAELDTALARLIELEVAAAQAAGLQADRDEQRRQLVQAHREHDSLRRQLAQLQDAESATLVQMHRTQAELESLAASREALEAKQAEAQSAADSRIAGLEAQLTEARIAAADSAERARQDHDELLRQLHRVQEELEQVLTGRLSAAAAREVELRSTADKRVADLEAQLVEAKNAATSIKQRARQDHDLLLVQLHQVQEELERYYLENERLAAKGAHLPAGVEIDQVQPGPLRDEPPHREFNATLRGVRLGTGSWPQVGVRLLDHHGHAGLALFAEPGTVPPVSAWRASGTEDGREFMLFIPSDANAGDAFGPLSGGDWQLLLAAATRMGVLVKERGGALDVRWQATAERLMLELRGMPLRWRFDQVSASPGSARDTVRLSLEGAVAADRHARMLAVVLDADGVTLEWSAEGMPPFASWPLDADGHPQRRWPVPVGAAKPEVRRFWRSLPEAERACLCALLDALPGALACALVEPGVDAVAAAARAEAMAQQARRAVQSPRWRRVVKAMLGRTER